MPMPGWYKHSCQISPPPPRIGCHPAFIVAGISLWEVLHRTLIAGISLWEDVHRTVIAGIWRRSCQPTFMAGNHNCRYQPLGGLAQNCNCRYQLWEDMHCRYQAFGRACTELQLQLFTHKPLGGAVNQPSFQVSAFGRGLGACNIILCAKLIPILP